MAQEWTYRWLGACLAELARPRATMDRRPPSRPRGRSRRPRHGPPTSGGGRWGNGVPVSDRGRIPADVVRRYLEATAPPSQDPGAR